MVNKKTLAFVLLAVLTMLASQAQAKRLDTFAGSIELPFDFQIKERIESANNSYVGLAVKQWTRITIGSGPLKGHLARITVSYYAPTRVEAGIVQGWMQKAAEEAAGKPGASDILPMQLSGFPFIEVTTDTTHEDKKTATDDAATADLNSSSDDADYARSTALYGSINNTTLTVWFSRPVNAEFDASATKSIKDLNLDFSSILKLYSRFEHAAKSAVVDRKMITPTGDYTAVDDLVPKLYAVWEKADGQGKVIAAEHGYSFFKTGFWAPQRMVFSTYCDLESGQDPKEIARMKDIKSSNDKETVVVTEGPVAMKLSGLDAVRIATRHTEAPPTATPKSDGIRWIASDHNILYKFDSLSAGGSSIQRNLIEQVDSHPLACKPNALLALNSATLPMQPAIMAPAEVPHP